MWKLSKHFGLMVCILLIATSFATIFPNKINAEVIDPEDTISYWKFENNFQDSVDGNHGTGRNGVTFVEGILGQAASFDGVDDYVRISHSQSLEITQEISISAWIYPGEYPNALEYYLHDAVTHARQYYLVLHNQKASFFLPPATRADWLDSVSDIPLNQWTYIVGTYDGSKMKIYVNGIEEAEQDATGDISIGADQKLLIGGSKSRYPDGHRFFNGNIDEVSIWDRALTAEEIQQLYENVVGDDPQITIENVITEIEDMNLARGIENSLVSKLDNAHKSLEKDNEGAAINQLNAFINAVEAQHDKKICEADADYLIEMVQSIIDNLTT